MKSKLTQELFPKGRIRVLREGPWGYMGEIIEVLEKKTFLGHTGVATRGTWFWRDQERTVTWEYV